MHNITSQEALFPEQLVYEDKLIAAIAARDGAMGDTMMEIMSGITALVLIPVLYRSKALETIAAAVEEALEDFEQCPTCDEVGHVSDMTEMEDGLYYCPDCAGQLADADDADIE